MQLYERMKMSQCSDQKSPQNTVSESHSAEQSVVMLLFM